MSTQVICLYLFIIALSEFWLLLDIYLKFSQSKLQLASYKIMSEEPAGVESHLAGHKAREGFQKMFFSNFPISILPAYSLNFAPVLGFDCCKAWGYDPHVLQHSRALGSVVRSVFS